MSVIVAWPRFMKIKTLAAFLDVTEAKVRELEKTGILPARNSTLGTFDSEAVVRCLVERAIGKEAKDGIEEAQRKTIERIRSSSRTRRRNNEIIHV